MKNTLTLCISLLCVLVLFSRCDKESGWVTNVDSVSGISSSGALIQAEFDVVGNRKDLEVGVCFGFAELPIVKGGHYVSDFIAKSTSKSFELENLNASTEYFIRSYIISSGEVIYSNPTSFVTAELENPACDLEDNKVLYESGEINAGSLTQIGDEEEWLFRSNNTNGQLEIKFSEKPVSRIYKTSEEETFLLSTDVSVKGAIYGATFSCPFRAKENQDVYVYANEDGGLQVKFCNLDLLFASVDFCEYDSYVLSANLKN